MKRYVPSLFAGKALLVFALLVFSGGFITAQSINAGVKAYEIGDYKGALVELDKAIADPKNQNDKALAKGLCYRGMTKVVLIRKNKGDLMPAMAKTVHEYAISAIEDFSKSQKLDTDKKLGAELELGQQQLQELLIQLADKALQTATHDGSKSNAEKQELYKNMLLYCAPVIANDKFNYKGYALTADAQLALGDSAKAMQNYKLATDWFFRSAPKDGDQAIAYVYIHKAELEWALNHDFDAAMKAIEGGKAELEGESKKIQSFGSRTPNEKAYFSQRREVIMTDINKAEMEIKAKAGKN